MNIFIMKGDIPGALALSLSQNTSRQVYTLGWLFCQALLTRYHSLPCPGKITSRDCLTLASIWNQSVRGTNRTKGRRREELGYLFYSPRLPQFFLGGGCTLLLSHIVTVGCTLTHCYRSCPVPECFSFPSPLQVQKEIKASNWFQSFGIPPSLDGFCW